VLGFLSERSAKVEEDEIKLVRRTVERRGDKTQKSEVKITKNKISK
jgi:hypothetical protein